MKNQNVQLIRYVPEQMMGVRKFRTKKRELITFIPTMKQRERKLTS
jgi:hypothetical protein